MRIAILGTGVSGLVTALELTQAKHQVTIWEKGDKPGGLAAGFQDPQWDWPLEMHYHHLFQSDKNALNLAKELNLNVSFHRPKTSIWVKDHIYPFDSPSDLLKFPHLNLLEKFSVAKSLTYLKYWSLWTHLESQTAKSWIIKHMGQKPWHLLWEPLFVGKFHQHSDYISAAWFWARIHKRSAQLGYFEGGFQSLTDKLTQKLQSLGATFHFNSPITSITPQPGAKLSIQASIGSGIYDRAVIAADSTTLEKILSPLPQDYRERLSWLEGLGTVNLILSLNKSLLTDGTYWLNINDLSFPFLALVEHTNFINRNHYHNQHLVYLGNYISPHHQLYRQSKSQLLNLYTPYLKKINPQFQKDWIINSWLFKAPFTQPIVTPHYSRILPDLKTPIPHAYWVSLQHIYPWDRGINYAVEWGKKVAKLVMESQ